MRDYIYENYEWEHLEKIYIAGDGAAWIKTGCDILEKAVFVLDRFHMEKYIQKSVSHLLDSAGDAKSEIYSAIKEKDKKEVRRIYRHIMELTEKESKRREVSESLSYLMNNWTGIIIQEEDAGAAWGCHAEGQVSHVLSSRMSSRPMGWSRKGADQMAKLRAYRMNGGKIIDLLKYQKEKLEKEKKLEKKEELVKGLRRSQAGRRYAQSLQCHVPGIEAHSMKWMREMLKGQLCG